MKLLNLKIANFKGIRSFELPANGNNVIVSGTNGTGKTSLFDAYTWLLFGKDSNGRSETNFEVKPCGSSGLTIEVTGEFEHNGQFFTLGKMLAEKFSKINGESEAERKPKNEYTYFINGVPKPKNQYTTFIAEICPEDTFLLLSDPDYFAGKINWKTRRKMLIDFFGGMDDRMIIQKHADEIGELITLIGCKSVADYKAMSIVERKKVIAEQDGIPARIDEAEKAKPAEMPKPDDGAKLGKLTMQKKSLEQQISDIENGVEISRQRGVIAELQAEFATEKAEHIQAQTENSDSSELVKAMAEASEIKDKLADVDREIHLIEAEEKHLKAQREGLLAEYHKINSMTFDEASTVCPTCGREYPEDKKQELLSNFNIRKSKDLESKKSEGLQIREKLQGCAESLINLTNSRDRLSVNLEKINAIIAEAKEVKPVPFESTNEAVKMLGKITEEQNVLFDLSQKQGAQISALRSQIADIDTEIAAINRRLASENQVKQQDKRIEQLKSQAKELGKRRADLDNGIELAEKFEQIKLSEIENNINSQFQYAKFKLFNRQINGGIAECCEVTVNGIPYTTNLNTAAKANAGLDIINVISKHMHVTAPIWLDGAESVVKYLPVEAQTIQLCVDGSSEQLRIYVEE